MLKTIFLMLASVVLGFYLGRRSMVAGDPAGVDRTAPARIPGDITPAARRTMEEQLRRGETIGAIRTVRIDTGCGLKEAKAFVDAYDARRKAPRPGDPIER
ncbi:ribosomal L7/L12 family protein [Sphingomicrobium arenosum]|uniref:hypothetical protein n=1 Tax=Sphingomicrobium arenosum TaxID=2233861 RepID=UPI0022410319|nr:hypothetical protein [Sphingomicrobium arenosum]